MKNHSLLRKTFFLYRSPIFIALPKFYATHLSVKITGPLLNILWQIHYLLGTVLPIGISPIIYLSSNHTQEFTWSISRGTELFGLETDKNEKILGEKTARLYNPICTNLKGLSLSRYGFGVC
jgi:hypothetical protein